MAARPSPRSIWTGSITFGLVTIPVKLFPAVREEQVHFHLLHDQDHARLQRRLVCSADGNEVHPEHIVKGFEIAPDQYVVVRQEELDAVAARKTRAINIEDFVDQGEIDPLYLDRSYYVLPQEAGTRAYRLLADAMEKSRKVGIARFVMRSKEYLAALRPLGGALCLDTMHFGDEVVPLEALGEVPARTKTDDRELKVAQQLIESLTTHFNADKYHDQYRQAVREMIEKKAAGEQVVTAPEPQTASGRVANLMDALQASLAQARRTEKPPQPHPPGETRRRKKGK